MSFSFCQQTFFHATRTGMVFRKRSDAQLSPQEYISHVDPVSQLGLSTDSIQGYNIGEVHRPSRPSTTSTPELLPCGYLVGDNSINIQLKGSRAFRKVLWKLSWSTGSVTITLFSFYHK